MGGVLSAVFGEDAPKVASAPSSVGSRGSELERLLDHLAATTTRFPFLSDGTLLYASTRLERKARAFYETWNESYETTERVQQGSRLRAATELAEAIIAVKEWALHAPGRRMRRSVAQGAFRSDL
jgi:hypothetical protein